MVKLFYCSIACLPLGRLNCSIAIPSGGDPTIPSGGNPAVRLNWSVVAVQIKFIGRSLSGGANQIYRYPQRRWTSKIKHQ
jgi:hypothetical protein